LIGPKERANMERSSNVFCGYAAAFQFTLPLRASRTNF
jgi:hypothetical protein